MSTYYNTQTRETKSQQQAPNFGPTLEDRYYSILCYAPNLDDNVVCPSLYGTSSLHK